MTSITYLGHAGFVVEHENTRVLIDPWFFPAFLESWFPYPDNRQLLEEVWSSRFDYVYISHTHEDHFDRRVLERLSREVTVLCPRYRSKALARYFRDSGFANVIELEHRQTVELADGIVATMILDTSHKEDSGLLLDLGGYRFLDLNDCNTPLSEVPADIDLLACQFSGAMWYPSCYDYEAAVLSAKVAEVRRDLFDTLVRKVRLTGAKAYLPSAGPACFLDPSLAEYNDPETTIFPRWQHVADAFTQACPEVQVLRAAPGDAIDVDPRSRQSALREGPERRLDEDLDQYRARRCEEWGRFGRRDDAPVSVAEIETYFGRLQALNKRFLGDFRKQIELISGSENFAVQLGRIAQYYKIEGEEPYDPEYTLIVSPAVLRSVIAGEVGWEEALLSMRVRLRRNPDRFDLTLMGLLRYGRYPAQTMQMVRERTSTEMIERDGLRMQRYCPHAGEDLNFAAVSDGRIECPRHHWVWDAYTGQCVEKGDVDLRVEPLDGALARQSRGADSDGLEVGHGA
jgi:UDP-MurNAc hydroxylase